LELNQIDDTKLQKTELLLKCSYYMIYLCLYTRKRIKHIPKSIIGPWVPLTVTLSILFGSPQYGTNRYIKREVSTELRIAQPFLVGFM
jgi:hypothetical protein